ncbi:isochorismatase family protein [Dactylosporangium sp. NPDC000244]|uniref:isochorismatase family protein n=1 Tax=Dactylosporangium sp. NPDC000244 TaxID=3154365 RepID=UPI00331A1F21|nr:phenazine biosynthesis protein PhzD [Dactylosporangium thailandense]
MAMAPIPPYPLPAEGDLPANTAGWRPDPRRAVLLIHDMQRYFLRPFAPEFRERLVGNVAALHRGAGLPVAYTVQPGGMTSEQRGLLADFWGPGMAMTPADREVVEPLTPGPDDWVFTKWRYSAFVRSDLLARMRAAGRDQLVVCGVYAHIGVLATLVEAFSHDIQPFLVADAVGDLSAEEHRLALTYAARRCAVVTTTAAVL